jgi:hypothetical protein
MGKDNITELRDTGFAEITSIICFVGIKVQWYVYLSNPLSTYKGLSGIIHNDYNKYIGKTLLTGDLITLWLYSVIAVIKCSRDTMWEKLFNY